MPHTKLFKLRVRLMYRALKEISDKLAIIYSDMSLVPTK